VKTDIYSFPRISPCHADFPSPSLGREKKISFICLFALLKSHFIKVMDNTSNKIATAAITVQPWHHIAEYTKYNSPFNTYDLQNLLQVRTFTRKWI